MFQTHTFKHQTILITGAADGIGFACAQTFARLGANVAILDIRSELTLQKVADLKAISSAASHTSAKHIALSCDVTDEASVSAAVKLVEGEYEGKLDVLINNAGIADMGKPTLAQDAAQFDKILRVGVHGTYLMSKAFAAAVFEQSQDLSADKKAAQCAACIVNLSSMVGVLGFPNRNAYGAAKAGIASMTRSMASEWARIGSRTPRVIRVNAVAPGYVQTSMVDGLIAKGMFDVAAIQARTPMGRLATPQDVANSIAFLCSPLASYTTGIVMSIDGGWSAFGAVQSALDS